MHQDNVIDGDFQNSFNVDSQQERLFTDASQHHKSGGFFVWLISIVVLFAILTAYLTQHIHVMNINIKMQKLEKNVTKIKRENELLEISLAKHTRMESIDALATNQLKMIRPERVEYIIVGNVSGGQL